MNRMELETLPHGPVHEALCLRCQNQTTDERCEGCIFGHFRGAEDFKLPCRKCHCQVKKSLKILSVEKSFSFKRLFYFLRGMETVVIL